MSPWVLLAVGISAYCFYRFSPWATYCVVLFVTSAVVVWPSLAWYWHLVGLFVLVVAVALPVFAAGARADRRAEQQLWSDLYRRRDEFQGPGAA